MKKESEMNNLLILLILLSVIEFLKTMVHVLFDKNLGDIGDKILKINTQPKLEIILTVLSILRSSVAVFIIGKRGFKNDLLTYIFVLFIFNTILKLYYMHLYYNYPNSKEKYYIDKYEDYSSILTLFASLYIVSYIFFHH